MSILIKGMAMPRDCPMCPFAHYANGYGSFTGCNFVSGKKYAMTEDKEYAESSERPSWCPLIELPPHGDLIDRDALMKDGWLSLWKRVDYMGGYAVHDLPLINPSIPVVIESEE